MSVALGARESELYAAGMSIPEVAEEVGVPVSTVYYRLKRMGVLRSRADGVRNASARGRLKSREAGGIVSPQGRENIRKARLAWGEKNASGVSLKPSGYLEITRGPNKGRSVHVVEMEKRLGRRLKDDECVHHIDGNKTNNDANNLALVTKSGHSRLHRRERSLQAMKKDQANGKS